MRKSGTNPLHAIFEIILSLHILLWRPEIRPRIALRLRANLVLLGRRRWKRFLEYWEGKTLENYFCARWVPWFVKNSPSQGLWSSWLCPNAFYAWNVFSSLTNYSKRESERGSMNRKWRTFFLHCSRYWYWMYPYARNSFAIWYSYSYLQPCHRQYRIIVWHCFCVYLRNIWPFWDGEASHESHIGWWQH